MLGMYERGDRGLSARALLTIAATYRAYDPSGWRGWEWVMTGAEPADTLRDDVSAAVKHLGDALSRSAR